ncbi:MAG: hypothetical protein AB7F20_14115, partial [Geoalkalibacter sp.]|uniref:hypothetical protein n=1 Tax=Geoalkalibacter sp. TaxID=3041440 RepID=UPI003D11EEDE
WFLQLFGVCCDDDVYQGETPGVVVNDNNALNTVMSCLFVLWFAKNCFSLGCFFNDADEAAARNDCPAAVKRLPGCGLATA